MTYVHRWNRPTKTAARFISTPTCRSCKGSTLGPHGEQCRACKGAGFMTYRGGQVAGLATERRR